MTNDWVHIVVVTNTVCVNVCDWSTQTTMFSSGLGYGLGCALALGVVVAIYRAIWGRGFPWGGGGE